MQYALGLAVRQNALSRRHRKHHAAANRFSARLVMNVAVVQVGFDIGDTDIRRLRVGDQRANLRPGTVCSHQEFSRRG